jgi:hypothetical protein
MESIPLRLLSGKVVGTLEGNRAVFSVQRSRHYFRKTGGYTLDAEIVRSLPPAALLEFRDSEIEETFTVPLDLFERFAVVLDFGYGLKVCAPEHLYQRLPKTQPSLFDLDSPASPGSDHAAAR